jgi:glycosyltransferase involved in cell wall biosynthesis
MSEGHLRLLYLSNAFPPGVSGRFLDLCTAAHPQETCMAQALARQAEICTVGLLHKNVWGRLEPRDDSLGLEHKLLLWERNPALWHNWRSWRQLRSFYLEEVRRNGMPQVLLVRNLTTVFNYFVRWLSRQPRRPVIVLILADSGLGQPVPVSRRLRYLFKPMQFLEEKAVLWYDACMGFGFDSQRHFEPRGKPWLWLPSAYNFYYEPPATPVAPGPIRFGYFGGLTREIGVDSMVKAFLDSGVPGSLRLCGMGGLTDTLKKLAGEHANLQFDGMLRPSDCLPWAQQVDVLVNPRLPLWGRDNSFPSKIFEFAMTGKAILSTRACGVDKVLKEAGIYADANNLESSLRQKFREVSAMDRDDLQRRGAIIRQSILSEYNWDAQARRIIEFLEAIVRSPEHSRHVAA